MATLPGGALPLPVPAPAPAKLVTLFADASMDPTAGNWAALMGSFLHDLHNNANNTATDALRDMVAASGAQNELLAFTIVHGNRARLYSLCMKWRDGLTGRNPALNNRFFALEGELIQDRGHIVELDAAVFNLSSSVTVVPEVATISDAIAADPAIITMAGSYASNDPGTEGVKTRKICPVPHSLVGLWLLHKEGITWQDYFGTIYPAINNLCGDKYDDVLCGNRTRGRDRTQDVATNTTTVTRRRFVDEEREYDWLESILDLFGVTGWRAMPARVRV